MAISKQSTLNSWLLWKQVEKRRYLIRDEKKVVSMKVKCLFYLFYFLSSSHTWVFSIYDVQNAHTHNAQHTFSFLFLFFTWYSRQSPTLEIRIIWRKFMQIAKKILCILEKTEDLILPFFSGLLSQCNHNSQIHLKPKTLLLYKKKECMWSKISTSIWRAWLETWP